MMMPSIFLFLGFIFISTRKINCCHVWNARTVRRLYLRSLNKLLCYAYVIKFFMSKNRGWVKVIYLSMSFLGSTPWEIEHLKQQRKFPQGTSIPGTKKFRKISVFILLNTPSCEKTITLEKSFSFFLFFFFSFSVRVKLKWLSLNWAKSNFTTGCC